MTSAPPTVVAALEPTAIRILRRVAAYPAIRRLERYPLLARAMATLARARLVYEPGRFLFLEAVRRPTIGRYRLRESGAVVHLRHARPDVLAFDEIFYQRIYEPPAHVEAALKGLGRPLNIVDLGGNVGLFGAFALGRFNIGRMLAFEPDADNADVLQQTIDANQNVTWTLVRACAMNAEGSVSFASGQFALSHVAGPEDSSTEVVPGVDIFSYLDDADLIKIDIEGAEWAILADQRLRSAPVTALVVEHHPESAPSPNPRRTATELLRAAGFEVEPAFATKSGYGGLWAWRASDPATRLD